MFCFTTSCARAGSSSLQVFFPSPSRKLEGAQGHAKWYMEVSAVTPPTGHTGFMFTKTPSHGTHHHLSPKLAWPSSIIVSSLVFDKMKVFPFLRGHVRYRGRKKERNALLNHTLSRDPPKQRPWVSQYCWSLCWKTSQHLMIWSSSQSYTRKFSWLFCFQSAGTSNPALVFLLTTIAIGE